jgi:membrane protease subunit (stomatin/prohibitin family)
MALTPEQCADLQAKLDEAKEQYHNLITGQMARVIVDQNGEKVEFTSANRTSLDSYIRALSGQLASCCGVANVTPIQTLGPASFIF